MRAFVAGATGYTGSHVVGELVAAGVTVYAHVRPDSARLPEWRERFEAQGAHVDTTPWQPARIRQTIQNIEPTHVFALLGTTRARAQRAVRRGQDESYETVDYGLTAMLLQATSHAKFIYLSSIGVKAGSRNAYFSVRWRIESELRASGLRYVIARPAFITGSDREDFRLMERVAATASNAAFGVAAAIGMRGLRDRFASMSGRALARALVNAALDPACQDTVLEAGQLRRLAER